ncbi:MAG: hypothetical protein VKJ04_09655 [Vampirovibrionales bacterium]|nr:hypothetical protein [Vampirovibrionales bacterium]
MTSPFMSSSLFEQLNRTVTSLEQQAVEQQRLGALLLWHCQSESHSTLLESILEPENPSETSQTRLYQLLNNSACLEASACYDTLAQLSALDMARFTFVQEFGTRFKDKPFYEELLQVIAAKI